MKKRMAITSMLGYVVAAVVACSGHTASWQQGFNYAHRHRGADTPTASHYCTWHMYGYPNLMQRTRMTRRQQLDWIRGCISGYAKD